jgi:uncharacterized membrane protein YkoI
MFKRKSFIGTTTLALALGGLLRVGFAKEVITDFDKAPAAVQAAIKKAVGGNKVEKFTRETEDKTVIYEAKYKVDGQSHSVEVSENGQVLEEEQMLDTGALPKAVSDAIKTKYADGQIGEVYLVKAKDKSFYEVDVTVDKEKHELRVSAEGKIQRDKIEAQDTD